MPKKSRVVAASAALSNSQYASKRKTKSSLASSFKDLDAVRATEVNRLKAKNTDRAYHGYITRGKKFLSDIVAKRHETKEFICSQGIPTDELEKALDNPPNRYSAIVVEMWITQKCFAEGMKEGVAMGIHAAFCKYWDEM
jgi:hypothetical protein